MKLSVQSVLEQTLANFELLVIDDCSTDGSYEWLLGLQDDRIELHRNQTNKGLFYNLNFLIGRCNTRLVKLWSQDDIMYPDCLASVVRFHERHPGIGFSYTGRDIIDENGAIKINKAVDNTPEIISTELHARIAYYTGSIAGNIANVCINKTALERVGLFNEQMKISADFDMWVRLAEHYDTGFIREKLIQLRDHKGQLSRNEKYYINHVKEDLQVYRYLDSYVTDALRMEGHKILHLQKLLFYFTLMVKSALKGDITTARNFYRAIAGYSSIYAIAATFVKQKIFKRHDKAAAIKSNC